MIRGLAIAAALVGSATSCRASKKTPSDDAVASATLPRTESASIAISNLDSRLRGARQRLGQRFDGQLAATAIDLLMIRARFLGAMDDYAAADELAASWLRAAPDDSRAHLAAAELSETLHRFDQARQGLARARALGLPQGAGDGLAAALAEADKDPARALALRSNVAARARGLFAEGSVAALRAELGDLAGAERGFRDALEQYRGVSPFAVAWLCLQWGHARELAGDVPGARAVYQAGLERLPGYVDLALHLAELEMNLGQVETAHDRLAPLAARSSHPQLLGTLANLAFLRGERERASELKRRAAASAASLEARYPEAFGQHGHHRRTAELGLGAASR